MTRVIYKFIPIFGELTDQAGYQAKSWDKLVNHSCQFMYGYIASLACFLTFYICNRSLVP